MPTSNTQSVATTLPARYYTDPDVFRDEVERFYCQTWICAGRANQVPTPGDYFLREVAGESLIITRDQGGSLLPFFNVCRHRRPRLRTRPQRPHPRPLQRAHHASPY